MILKSCITYMQYVLHIHAVGFSRFYFTDRDQDMLFSMFYSPAKSLQALESIMIYHHAPVQAITLSSLALQT